MPNELTNPNTVVTEERLAQFYQQILPYLGGMPEVLANKFNRADLYSTDEKLIGRWIDGKPLYEKVIIQTDYNINGSWKYIPTGIVNLGDVVELKGTFNKSEGGADIYSLSYGAGSAFISLVINKAYDKIAISSGESRTGKLIVVIKYTKTTDSAVEIGDDTDYSTTEKIVGTWIDGKPLYQKSVQIDNPSSTGQYVTAFAIQNFGTLVKAEGIAVRASDTSIYAFNGGIRPEVPANYQYSVSIRYFSGNIEYLIGSYNNVSTLYITIQYTKTS